jgi:hypothetical protein
MNDYNTTIFPSRYYAEKAKKTNPFRSSDIIVKVCAGGDKVGYVLMDPANYSIWKKQK